MEIENKDKEKIEELKKSFLDFRNGEGAKNTDIVKRSFEKLEELRGMDISSMDTESDDYRKHINAQLMLENVIRQQCGLEDKEYLILDSTLNDIIRLGAQEEFIEGLPTNQKGEIKDRINQIVTIQQRKQEREENYISFVAEVSDRLSVLEKVHPEQYLIVDGELKPNPKYLRWVRDLFSLKKKLDKQKMLEESLAKNEVNDFQQDKRGSIYRLSEKVDGIITKYDLKESD